MHQIFCLWVIISSLFFIECVGNSFISNINIFSVASKTIKLKNAQPSQFQKLKVTGGSVSPISGNFDWRYSVAGAVALASSHATVTPIGNTHYLFMIRLSL